MNDDQAGIHSTIYRLVTALTSTMYRIERFPSLFLWKIWIDQWRGVAFGVSLFLERVTNKDRTQRNNERLCSQIDEYENVPPVHFIGAAAMLLHNLRERTHDVWRQLMTRAFRQLSSSYNKKCLFIRLQWCSQDEKENATRWRIFPKNSQADAPFVAMIVPRFWWIMVKFCFQASSLSFNEAQCCLVKVRWAVLSMTTFRARWLILHRIIFVRTARRKIQLQQFLDESTFTFDDERFDFIGRDLHSLLDRFERHFLLIFCDLEKG